MSATASPRHDVRRRPGAGAHTLLVADAATLRHRVATRIGRELAAGSQVLYRAHPGAEELASGWLLGPEGPATARAALAAGQLELVDQPAPPGREDGDPPSLFRRRFDRVERAVASGWRSVAVVETVPTPDGDAARLAGRERGHDLLAARWPVTTLCLLVTDGASPDAVWEAVAVHHPEVAAARWSARTDAGRWHLAGEIDAHGAREFGAAVYGALRGPRDVGGSDLDVDLGRVVVMDEVCARILVLTARTVAGRRGLVLHRVPGPVRTVLERVGRPRSVVVAEDRAAL